MFQIQDQLQVYPANARGLLQAIQNVEASDAHQITKPLPKGTS
jgi:hypothetical protein